VKLKAIPLDIYTGGRYVAVMNKERVESMNLHPQDRILIKFGSEEVVAIIDTTERGIGKDEIGTYKDTTEKLGIKKGDLVEVVPAKPPESVEFIKEKINNQSLNYKKILKIIEDVVERNITDIELASFVTALHLNGVSLEEAEYLSRAMAETGRILELGKKPIYDKHSIGGVPGDKTTMLVVPIVASAGLIIPKTSSKAITSPAGTANRVGVLTNVDLTLEEIKEVVEKTNGCMAWGGSMELAPADDLLIQVEYPIGVDPMLLPSIMAKKKSVGADYVVIDIPVGRGAKIRTMEEAQDLADSFIELGRRLGMSVRCGITYGEQPIGYAMGPALEALEALKTLMGDWSAKDLVEKATSLAGMLLELSGEHRGKEKALKILKEGVAEKKFREIIGEQGGDPDVKPSDIQLGDKVVQIKSNHSGQVLWLSNPILSEIARAAGAPKDEGAGVLLNKKVNDLVNKGDLLFTIYAESERRMDRALEILKREEPVIVRKKITEKMLLEEVPGKKQERFFLLER